MAPQLDDFELEIIGCEDDIRNKTVNRRDLMSKTSSFLNKPSSEIPNSFHKRKRELAKVRCSKSPNIRVFFFVLIYYLENTILQKNAIHLIKQKGGITKTNPNQIRPDKKNASSVNVAKWNTAEDGGLNT